MSSARLVRSIRLARLAPALAFLAWTLPAHAQRDEVVASAQFDKGLAEMEAGRYASACPALAESYRLDPRPGVLFTLAECETRWGKVASAMAHYGDFIQVVSRLSADQQARQRERVDIATKQTKALQQVVPQLTLVLPSSAPADLVVKRDGSVLGRPSLGIALPVDPGEHTLVVEASDGGKREQRVTLATGEKIRVELQVPAPLPRPIAKPGPEAPTSSVHPLTYVAFGTAVAGLTVGGITGALVLGKKSTIQSHCVDTACDQEGLDAAQSAKTLGLVSTIGVAVGAAGLTLGVVLLVTSRSSDPPRRSAIRAVVSPIDHGGAAFAVGTW